MQEYHKQKKKFISSRRKQKIIMLIMGLIVLTGSISNAILR